jgi:sporulation protein YlmC with PRC-barrel domain
MEFELGSPVHTADGQKVGTVDRIVQLGPRGPVQAIVVHKGHLLTRDILVPRGLIQSVGEDGVHLRANEKRLDDLPDFIESEFALPLEDSEAPAGFTMGTVMFPHGVEPGVAPMIVEDVKHIPQGESDIGRGFAVRCRDGEVGVVRDVLVDAAREVVDGLMVETVDPDIGTIRVPADLIVKNDDEVITLNCSREQLRAYRHAGQ